MHGVRKSQEPIAADIIKQAEDDERPQIAHYKGLVNRTLNLRDNVLEMNNFDVTAIMSTTTELLTLNTDFMTAWSLRRKTILKLINEMKDYQAMEQESDFSVMIIKLNPKSYGAWYHRKWIMEERSKNKELPCDVSKELKLSAKLLDLDPRNFHCWNYRWYLTQTFSVDIKEEFDFTTLMIYKNFSNYSAWHRRSLLFPKLKNILPANEFQKAIDSDLKLVKSAYFTEPADQSCWFYLEWLLEFATSFASNLELIKQTLTDINELLSMEPDASLALFTWVKLAKKINLSHGSDHSEECIKKSTLLAKIDPMRKSFYHHASAF